MSDFDIIQQKLKAAEGRIIDTALDVLQIEARKSVRKNFEAEGRPKWVQKKRPDGRKTLRGRTHRLFDTLNFEKKTSIPGVEMGSGLVYSKIHQEGGRVPTRKGKGKKSSVLKTKAYFDMPQRKYLDVPAEDFPRIGNSFKRAFNNISI